MSLVAENKYQFKKISTQHLRIKEYKKANCYTDSEKFEIGQETIFVIMNMTEIIVKKVPRYAVYVPLQNSLKRLLETREIFLEIETYLKELSKEKEICSHPMQGELWIKKCASNINKVVLPLHFYTDDFEPGNSLGSHAGIQKLTGGYIALPFLPPHLVHKKENILLSSIFYTKHWKLFGNEAVFQKIIEAMNLSEQGIQINVNGKTQTIHFQLTLILGDNLGLNSACGFVESFRAVRYGRFCTATSTMCEYMTYEDTKLLRNKTNYEQHVKNASYSSGIKEECVFNSVKNFHVTENKTVDMMHDVCEGIIPYTHSRILTMLVTVDKFFTLEQLNEEIEKFNYGDYETNKPRPLRIEHSKEKHGISTTNKIIKFKQSAAESLCLCRYFERYNWS